MFTSSFHLVKMGKIKVKYFLESEFGQEPKQGTIELAGYDLFAAEAKTFLPHQSTLVCLDLRWAIPKGFCGLALSRSSLIRDYNSGRYLIDNYLVKNKFLKKIIRRKLRGDSNLSTYKVFLRVCAHGEEDFNPTEFLEKAWGEYFEKLRVWKIIHEQNYLKQRPHLREPKRHLKSKAIIINL